MQKKSFEKRGCAIMPKIRVRSSKPNTGGSYNQGRKLGKARNHTHQFKEVEKIKHTVEVCKIPTCREIGKVVWVRLK